MVDRDKPITLAAITGAHGVAGEVRLKLFGEGIASLRAYNCFNQGALTLAKIRDDNKGGAIARFAEVTDRNAAEALRGTTLTITRADLPPLEEGEYYHADLIGLAAVTEAGEAIGKIVAVMNYGAGDIVEIERESADGKDGKKFMVPMIEAAVPRWDEKTLTVSDDFLS